MPSSPGMTTGWPACMNAMSELVVPEINADDALGAVGGLGGRSTDLEQISWSF